MSRNALFGIAAVIIVLLAFVFMRGNAGMAPADTGVMATTTPEASSTPSAAKPSPAPAKPAATTNTFVSVFAQSGTHECIYEQVTSNSQSKNVIQIADGKMHGEFRTTSGAITNATFMTYVGGTLYTWKQGATVGTKTGIRTIADLPSIIPRDLTSGAIFGTNDNNVGWDCHAWAKNAAAFTLPSYVSFK